MDPEREIFGALPPRRDDSPEFLDKETGFWAEIETDEGNGKYTFKEKVRNDATTWADKTGGRTGDCYESNDTTGIAEKTIIQIRIEHDATGTLRYIFDVTSAIPPGTADKQMLAWDNTTDKAWELILPDGIWLDVDLATGKLIAIGPGPECYVGCCGVESFSLDAIGNVRWLAGYDSVKIGPCRCA